MPIGVRPATVLPLDDISEGQFFLLVDKQIRVAENGPTQYYRHFAVQVVNASGMEAASRISIVFDPEYQTLRFHRLVIHRDGKPIDKLPHTDLQLLRREEDLDSAIYDGRYTADAIVEDVRVGDIIEYAYTLQGDNPIYNGMFFHHLDTTWSVPVRESRFRLLWPANRQLHQKNHNCNQVLAGQRHGKYSVYSLLQEYPEPILSNTEAPDWFRRHGYIQIGEMDTWADVVAWALPLYAPAYQPDPAIQALAERLCQSATDDENKVVCLLNYVQNEIRYLGLEFGVNSHKPSLPQTTLGRRYGDCKDKTVALIALLSAMGFETRPVLVHTELQKEIGRLQPTPRAFNHVIARATVNGRHYWLDPVRQYQGLNLEKIFQPNYGKALVIAAGETSLTEMPDNHHLVGVCVEETFDLREGYDTPPSYTVATRYQGLNADNLRRWIAEEGSSAIAKDYLHFYAKYYPRIETAKPLKIMDDPASNVLRLEENYRIIDFWENDDAAKHSEGFFYANALYPYLSKPAQRQRHEPYGIDHPIDVRQKIRVLLPEPREMQPSHFSERNAHFTCTAKTSCDPAGTTMTLDYQYRSLTDAVQPEALPGYLAALDRLDSELDYRLTRPDDTGKPLSVKAVFHWVQANPILGAVMTIGAILFYCSIEWRIDARRASSGEGGFYYPVSPFKLCVLSFATLGLYHLFWFYRNWHYIKQRDDSPIMPFWRAVFIPVWFFPFYRDLQRDSEGRFGKSILPKAPWIAILLGIWLAANAADGLEGPLSLAGLLAVLSLLPFANYILYINRHQPETVRHVSAIRLRHYLLTLLAVLAVTYNFGAYLNWIPNGLVVKGEQLPSWDVKFMHRLGILRGDGQLIYFYSDAFLLTRNDGNGVTDRNVFSYWHDDESDELFIKSAAYEDIEEISIKHAASHDDNTVITVIPKSGASFVLYASGREGRDKLFVKAIRDRLTP